MAGEDDDDDLAAEWGAAMAEQVGEDAEAMAAEWAAMLGGPTVADDGGRKSPDRVLNQEEVDGLLGFNPHELGLNSQSGIRAIINSALVSYERLPMLEIVFDRLVRLLTTSLRNFTSDNVEVSLDGIRSVRFGDYLNSIPLPAILSVFKAHRGRLRADDGGQRADLLDHRRAAGRPPRRRDHEGRGPPLHHDRDQLGPAHDRGGAGGRRTGVPADHQRQLFARPA
ncbi:hypothetical protein METY_0093 [Methylopila sp. Yamaguchi]|nr:hypothetical protein METY_0093 [Methylopila sp. Yamaguchi]